MGVYIAESQLPALRLYKYSGVDKSLLSKYLLQPYWNAVVKLVPLWVAPNVLTLVGFLFAMAGYGIMAWHLPTLQGTTEPWVYFIAALFAWIYQTLDAIDGKQARRTGMSGPLGELFDHGCDSLNATFSALTVASTLQLTTHFSTLCLMVIALLGFFLATWEEYYTGTLFLGVVNGPVEGFVMMEIFHLIAAWSPNFWAEELFWGLQRNWIFIVILVAGFVATTMDNIKAVRKEFDSNGNRNPQQDPHGPRTFAGALTEVVLMVTFAGLWMLWMWLSPEDLLVNYTHAMFATLGFVWSSHVDRVITAHLVHDEFRVPFPLWLPMLAGLSQAWAVHVGILAVPVVAEWMLIYGYLVVAVVSYFHFAGHVIADISSFLDIPVFTVRPNNANE